VGKPGSTAPVIFFFLVLPYGISSGFVSITLPFILTRTGFSVAIAASAQLGCCTARLCSPSFVPCSRFLFLERSTLLRHELMNEKSFASALIKETETAFLHRR
jgi:hypothetical protein